MTNLTQTVHQNQDRLKYIDFTTGEKKMSAKEKVLEYIKTHIGAKTSNIILSLNDELDVETVIHALDELVAEDKIEPKEPAPLLLTALFKIGEKNNNEKN